MKKLFLLCFIILVSGSILSAHNSNDLTGFYSGKLGKKHSITLSLKQCGDEINGYYHYNKNKTDIRLQGKINQDGIIELEEYGFFEKTGYWSGKLNGDKFTGTWTSGDKKKTLNFFCSKISMEGAAGEPMNSKVAFGEIEIEVARTEVTVPKEIAEKLFNEMVEFGEIDVELEYTKEVIKKGKENPSILFSGENVDLNNDKIPELVVYPSGSEGACTSSNCRFWIFQKTDTSYNNILSGVAGIFGYRVLNEKYHDFYDVALVQHASAIEHEYDVYRFNGKEYKLNTCITETGNEDKNGELSFTYKEHDCN